MTKIFLLVLLYLIGVGTGMLALVEVPRAGVVIGKAKPNPYANGKSHYEQSKQKAYKEGRLNRYRIEKDQCNRGRVASCAALHNYEDLK